MRLPGYPQASIILMLINIFATVDAGIRILVLKTILYLTSANLCEPLRPLRFKKSIIRK